MTLTIKQNYMQQALQLAIQGAGFTSPNPMVGCVIVKDSKIVGVGYHKQAGEAHAEINALQQAGKNARGAIMFVTLEPCSHWGKTPPCTKTIVESGIRSVVVAMKDPNPRVNGKGIAFLKRRGIYVETGIVKEEAQKINEIYCTFISKQLPFIAVKIAQSLDGKIADAKGRSQWISNQASRQYVHKLRTLYDAVLIGVGTVLQDNPRLTSRIPGGRNPYRIILDSQLRTPLTSKLITQNKDKKTILVTALGVSQHKIKQLERLGIEHWTFRPGRNGLIPLRPLIKRAAKREISSLLVEGGQQVFSSTLCAGIVHKVFVFIAPKLIGEGHASLGPIGTTSVREALALQKVEHRIIDHDILITGYCN